MTSLTRVGPGRWRHRPGSARWLASAGPPGSTEHEVALRAPRASRPPCASRPPRGSRPPHPSRSTSHSWPLGPCPRPSGVSCPVGNSFSRGPGLSIESPSTPSPQVFEPLIHSRAAPYVTPGPGSGRSGRRSGVSHRGCGHTGGIRPAKRGVIHRLWMSLWVNHSRVISVARWTTARGNAPWTPGCAGPEHGLRPPGTRLRRPGTLAAPGWNIGCAGPEPRCGLLPLVRGW